MAYGRDHRNPRGVDCADHHLFVERPEILQASPAARDHQAIHGLRHAIQLRDGRGDLRGRPVALHADGDHEHVGPAPAAGQDLKKIVDRGPGGAGHHADPPR